MRTPRAVMMMMMMMMMTTMTISVCAYACARARARVYIYIYSTQRIHYITGMTRDGRIELLEEKPVTLPLRTPQRPHELHGMVASLRVTTWFSMSGGKLGGGLREGGEISNVVFCVPFARNCKMLNGLGWAVATVCHIRTAHSLVL